METNPNANPEESGAPAAPVAEPAETSGPQEYTIVPAKVVRLEENAAVVDFGWKAEGRVPFNEFETIDGQPKVAVGDSFEVLVESLGEGGGKLVLSKEKAEKLRLWDRLAELAKSGDTVEGEVVAKITGGYSVDVGMQAFLPGSQASLRRLGRPEALVGEKLEFVISEFDQRRGKLVLSRKVLLEKEQQARKAETLAKITEGAVLPGVVSRLTDYGAFIDLGGVDGLLHVSEMSWGRINHPREVLKTGQEVTTQVLKFDAEKEKISLGLKQLIEDPWNSVPEKYAPKTEVTGKVVGFADFGAFVQLEPGVEGLVHVSELSWTKRVKHPSDELKQGQKVKAVVLDVDPKNRRLGLSIRQLQPNPWTSIAERFPPGTVLERKVKSITEFGLFLEIEEGIDGLVHISELSWTGKVHHPGDLYKVGDEVKAVVLDVDVEHERFSLSIKQLTPDPWQELKKAHPPGSRVKGTVTRVTDFGAFVELQPGIEGLVHVSELGEERVEKPSDVVKPGDTIEVAVLSIDTRDRKVSLSVKALSQAEIEDYREHMTSGEAKTTLGDLFGNELKAAGKPEGSDEPKGE